MLDLGLEHGLASVSVDQIAERAGVSTRTFFNYFDTKEDAALLQLFTVTEEELTAFVGGAAAETWSDLSRVFLDDADVAAEEGADVPRYLQLQHANAALAGRQLAVFARFEARLSTAVTTRLGDDLDAQLRGALMVGCGITAVRVALNRWVATDHAGPVRPHLEEALAVMAPSFAA
ncbi:TetR/AcrR family transcriptional regulator [uncultured Friedmanniella sp.]|uniref:TetR/AcrR family transcriptional regulator n=1 Tax=uncultured Friedmanniella sp. TaxID=335381 RepID=UPI0035CC140E